jgi:hypothetical protein
MGVGMGLMVNNTVGQIQGFLQSGGVFERTPKGSTLAARQDAEDEGDVVESGLVLGRAPAVATRPTRVKPQAYASPLDWTFFAEILVIAYCAFGATMLIEAGEAFWSVPMFMWALCMGLMVQQQMLTPRAA